jgi:hypothetical protein
MVPLDNGDASSSKSRWVRNFPIGNYGTKAFERSERGLEERKY